MTYHVVAANHAEESENRIHSDDIAQRYGFSGALVPGVAVFGYMSHEVTRTLGASWLGRSIADLRLLKPAYAGERLAIELRDAGTERWEVTCCNPAGALLATLSVARPATMPEPDRRWRAVANRADAPREPIRWEAIDVDTPFSAFVWQPTRADNRLYADHVSDDLPVYASGVLHPHLIQHLANVVLVRRFVMPAWVHVGTEMRFHRTLVADEPIELRTTPIEKWERKGHQFVKLYIAWVVDGAPAVEAWHTAIFRLAERLAEGHPDRHAGRPEARRDAR